MRFTLDKGHFITGDTLAEKDISRATLGRIPAYLRFLKSIPQDAVNISATSMARGMGFGEVKVRKDLGALCGTGRPKIGYVVSELTECLEGYLGSKSGGTIIIGAGQLGKALLDYDGFSEFGITILAAFDKKIKKEENSGKGKPILPMEKLAVFCKEHDIQIGIITVPKEAAQEAGNLLYQNGIRAMWCFAPCRLNQPADAVIQYENMALSLAHLKMQINRKNNQEVFQ